MQNIVHVTTNARFFFLKLADELLSEPFNGKSRDWRLGQIAKGADPLLLPKPSTLRKIIAERRKPNVVGAWRDMLHTVSATYITSHPSRICAGYIQDLRVDRVLRVSLFTENQLKAIRFTPYQHRIVHGDATGNLYQISKRQDDGTYTTYKRILNYFFLLKNPSIPKKEATSNKFILGKLSKL
jgi:hypothetical protein